MKAPFAVPDADGLTQVGRSLIDHYNALFRHHTANNDPDGWSEDFQALLHEVACVLGFMVVKSSKDPEEVANMVAEVLFDATDYHATMQVVQAVVDAGGEAVVFRGRE